MANPKKGYEIPTIDVALVTIKPNEGEQEIALNTASQIAITMQTETTDSTKLVVKGVLIAQKPQQTTITGNTIVLTDNVFNPQVVKILQGGTIKYWTDDSQSSTTDVDAGFGVASYTPPVAGSSEKGEIFTLNAYSAIYNAAGIITGYEKISYPNCQGIPIGLNSQDNVFRAPEYTINSAPNTGEAPYVIDYVKTLPAVDPVK